MMNTKQRKMLKSLVKIASQKSGKCLSCIYKNNITPLEWQCKRGHMWKMPPAYIKDGSWCKECKKIDILEGMKAYAKSRGGECLSKKFINSKTKLLWECPNGHQWKSNTAKYNKSWCPVCSSFFFLSEEKCRFILESITGELFCKDRVVLGNKLELDGYCEKINMAFEYQGYQHFNKAYYYDDNSLKKRKIIDDRKRALCEQKNILLLDIPYYINTSDSSLLLYILNKLKKLNIKLVTKKIDWDNFISEATIINTLDQLSRKRGGKLISKSYRGCLSKLEFECHRHHRWFTVPGNIKLGSWCPKCNAEDISLRNRNSILDVQYLATKHNSILISTKYRNNVTPLKWGCKQCNQRWAATLNCMKTRLLKNHWCLHCKSFKGKLGFLETMVTIPIVKKLLGE